MTPVPVLFLDIDGTVRKGKDELGRFVNTANDVEVFDEAVTMMRDWRGNQGGRVVGVSNQGGVALGFMSREEMFFAMEETVRQVRDGGGHIDFVIGCVHHPDAVAPEDRWCLCRKPRYGMLVGALDRLRELYPKERHDLNRSLMVGDRPEDEACAEAAGIEFMPAADWRAQARLVAS